MVISSETGCPFSTFYWSCPLDTVRTASLPIGLSPSSVKLPLEYCFYGHSWFFLPFLFFIIISFFCYFFEKILFSYNYLNKINYFSNNCIAALTMSRLAVFNLLTVSLLISSNLGKCLGLSGACLLILQLPPIPGDALC